MPCPRLLLWSFAWLPWAATAAMPASPPTAADTVVIYRCTAPDGALSLRDTPCAPGQRQQVLRSARPKDPPAQPVPPPPAPAPPPAPVAQVPITREVAPQPMYECITADGQRYTSDDGEGHPRWVPSWGFAAVPGPGIGTPRPGRLPGAGSRSPAPGGASPGPGLAKGGVAIIPYGSVLVRDACHVLPQQEACDRLRDRRWELIRRYNSALQSEQHAIMREQRSLDARLARDCGGP